MKVRASLVWLMLAGVSPGQTIHAVSDMFKLLATPVAEVRHLSYLVFAVLRRYLRGGRRPAAHTPYSDSGGAPKTTKANPRRCTEATRLKSPGP